MSAASTWTQGAARATKLRQHVANWHDDLVLAARHDIGLSALERDRLAASCRADIQTICEALIRIETSCRIADARTERRR